MILPVSASPSEIMRGGRQFPWPRPHHCPRCGSTRLWGHGYVERYFDEVTSPVWVKRYRCPDCGAVHTCRPDTPGRRFWAPIPRILASLRGKLSAGCPWREVPRAENGSSTGGKVTGSRAISTAFPPPPSKSFLRGRLIVATHSLTARAIVPFPEAPYRRLASTAPPVGSTLSPGEDDPMDRELRQQIALFRLGVIADLVSRKGMSRGEQEARASARSSAESGASPARLAHGSPARRCCAGSRSMNDPARAWSPSSLSRARIGAGAGRWERNWRPRSLRFAARCRR